MRYLYYPILLLFFSVVIFPLQSQHITWGEDPRSNSRNYFFMTIGENHDGIYVLSHSSRKGELSRFSIERYSHNLFFQSKKSLRLKNQKLERIQVLKNNIFYSTIPLTNKGVGTHVAQGVLIDRKLENFFANVSLVSLNIESRSQEYFFKVKTSPNYEYIGAFGFKDKFEDKKKQVSYVFYDSLLNKIVSKNFELNYQFSEDEISEIFLDNKGNFYMVVNRTLKDKKIGEGRFDSELIYYNFSTDYLVQLSITDPEFRVKDLSFSYDDRLKLVFLTGFFGQESQQYQTGIFQIGIGVNDGAIKVNTFTDIPMSFVGDVVGDKYLGQGIQLSQFFIKKVVRTLEGKSIIIAERYFSEVQQDQFWTNGVPVNISKRVYHYDEILVLSLDTLGQINWNKVIKKKQTSEEDNGYFSSVLIGVTPDYISIIYNDRMGGAKDVLQYLVKADGDVQMKVLLPADNFYTFIIPIEGRQVGYNRIVVPVTRQRDYSLIKITYPN